MKYKIEIWQFHNITTTYENDYIEEILKWYRRTWKTSWEFGNCSFEVYEDGKRLEFEEKNKLGFYDDEY